MIRTKKKSFKWNHSRQTGYYSAPTLRRYYAEAEVQSDTHIILLVCANCKETQIFFTVQSTGKWKLKKERKEKSEQTLLSSEGNTIEIQSCSNKGVIKMLSIYTVLKRASSTIYGTYSMSNLRYVGPIRNTVQFFVVLLRWTCVRKSLNVMTDNKGPRCCSLAFL